MCKLYVLSGASGIGKSTLMFKLNNMGLCKIAPKYSEREIRKGKDDIIHVDNIYEECLSCDIIYELYDTKYGINTFEIKSELETNNLIVAISDVDSLRRMRDSFKDKIVTIYISFSEDHIDDLIEAYINREEMEISFEVREEFCRLAKLVIQAIKTQQNLDINEQYNKMRHLFSDSEKFEDFVKRLESWVRPWGAYEKNKSLFDKTFKSNESAFKFISEMILYKTSN